MTPRADTFMRYWLPVYAWMALVAAVSAVPLEAMPHVTFFGADKVAHFIEYAVLGILWIRALIRLKPSLSVFSLAVIAIAIGVLFGAGDEFHQYFVPGRTIDVFDWLFDCAGAMTGVLAYTRSAAYVKS